MPDTKKTLVTLPVGVIEEIDEVRGQVDRSKWIADACLIRLGRKPRHTPASAPATPIDRIDVTPIPKGKTR